MPQASFIVNALLINQLFKKYRPYDDHYVPSQLNVHIKINYNTDSKTGSFQTIENILIEEDEKNVFKGSTCQLLLKKGYTYQNNEPNSYQLLYDTKYLIKQVIAKLYGLEFAEKERDRAYLLTSIDDKKSTPHLKFLKYLQSVKLFNNPLEGEGNTLKILDNYDLFYKPLDVVLLRAIYLLELTIHRHHLNKIGALKEMSEWGADIQQNIIDNESVDVEILKTFISKLKTLKEKETKAFQEKSHWGFFSKCFTSPIVKEYAVILEYLTAVQNQLDKAHTLTLAKQR